MSKWQYIRKISEVSNRYGDKLLELMELAGVNNLPDVPEEIARQYYEQRIKKEDREHGIQDRSQTEGNG